MRLDYTNIAQRHYDWVERMGWHNKTSLEAMALISSEVGEAVAELCDEVIHMKRLGEELADIVLRTLDLMLWEKFDLETCLTIVEEGEFESFSQPTQLGPLESLSVLMIPIAKAVNSFRKESTIPQAGVYLAELISRVELLATFLEIDLMQCLEDKVSLNETRGTRGRVK